ncbi:hypothetical protein [Nostoc sp. PA-18-2419]|uniref:hypothetical protein n=1 Tax=Nostoc sp. PA-18-2419 TaxID=2575443 RepID=UPI001108EE86|nr:hypothetical protein [Nostoc sp. PA-18-2419]
MTENLPQFERLPINPKKEEEDKEIWQPSWDCFCCQDTGQIQAHLVRLIIPDYDHNRDRIPVCQGYNKFYRHNLMKYGVLDTRFDLFLCKKLDRISHDNWKQITQKQFEKYRNQLNFETSKISQSHSLTNTNRTGNDNREVGQRKAEIEAINTEQWKSMRNDYLAGKKDE